MSATPFRRRSPARLWGSAWRVCGSALLCIATVTTAQPTAVGAQHVTDWSTLEPAQRRALEPLASNWASIDAPRRAKWLEIAARFDRMPPAERARVQQRMADWVQLSPQQRGEARQTYQGARQLSAQERRERWDAYKALPDDQRRSLADRARGPGAAGRPVPSAATSRDSAKVNTVPNPLLEARRPRVVAPSVVQAEPGVTTNSIAARPAPPLHQQTGLPKVAATPEFVDKATLLPQRGPQGAAPEPRRK